MATSTRIGFRLSDGSRLMHRFPKSAPVRVLFEYIKSEVEDARTQPFEASFIYYYVLCCCMLDCRWTANHSFLFLQSNSWSLSVSNSWTTLTRPLQRLVSKTHRSWSRCEHAPSCPDLEMVTGPKLLGGMSLLWHN